MVRVAGYYSIPASARILLPIPRVTRTMPCKNQFRVPGKLQMPIMRKTEKASS